MIGWAPASLRSVIPPTPALIDSTGILAAGGEVVGGEATSSPTAPIRQGRMSVMENMMPLLILVGARLTNMLVSIAVIQPNKVVLILSGIITHLLQRELLLMKTLAPLILLLI